MEQPPPIQNAPPSPTPAMPLWARLLNIFAVPGDVFEHVRISRMSVGNWLLPLFLVCLVTAVSACIVASQPAMRQQMRELQDKQIEEQVRAGKVSAEDAEKLKATWDKIFSPTMMKIMGSVGGIVAGTIKVLGWAFVLWLIGKAFLKFPLGFGKALEVSGLAVMIAVLGVIVTLLLQVNFSNPSSSPSLAMTVDFDPKNLMHLALAALNLFDLWHLFVMAIGLTRLTGQPFMRTSFAVVGFWLVWMTLTIGVSSVAGGFAR